MKTYKQDGIYGEGTVYVLETLEDWDEYEAFLGDECIRESCPNFYEFKEDFKKYIGKFWKEKDYTEEGEQFYRIYKIIAMEDNEPWMDWYWVIQNVDDDRDIQYILVNDAEFYGRVKLA